MNKLLQLLFCSITCLVVSGFVLSCSKPQVKEPPPKLVKAVRIGDPENLSQRAFPGRAKAAEEAVLSFRVNGQLISRQVKVGDSVEKGALLASIDPADYQNALDVVRGELAKATAALADAEANYTRSLNVRREDAGAISQQAIDRTKALAEMSRAARDSAQSAVNLAQDRLEYASLKAPFSGEIVAVYVEAHESVLPKQPVLKLLNRSAIEFKIDVPETLIGYANQVESAHVRFDVKPDTNIEATIKEVGREASRGTRTYPVTLLLEPTDKFELLPGMAGKAFIQARPLKGDPNLGIQIPAAALFSHGDKDLSFVWIVNDSKLERRQVTVGMPSDHGIRITSGLNKGESVVVAGATTLSEGQAVRIMNPKLNKAAS